MESRVLPIDAMAQWSRKFRKHSGSLITVTLIGALLCFALAQIFLMSTDAEDEFNRRRREQFTRNRQSHHLRKMTQESLGGQSGDRSNEAMDNVDSNGDG